MTAPDLDATVERHELALDAPFEIARGTTTSASVVTVELRAGVDGEDLKRGVDRDVNSTVTGDEDADADADGAVDQDERDGYGTGTVGIGATSPSSYYEEDADSVEDALADLLEGLPALAESVPMPRGTNSGDDATTRPLAQIEDDLAEARPDDPAARAALSIALYDLAARRLQIPLYRLWGLDPTDVPPTSYTVGIGTPAWMADRAREATSRGFDHLKVKLGAEEGTDDSGDAERLAAVREAAPEATIRVDVNGAWDRDTALERLTLLDAQDVALLEQPVPAADIAALRAVTEQASIPVAADESCVDADDVGWVADACDVVVCKLVTCGGVAAARRQIEAAHEYDLDVLLGCMVESNASIAAAWHLAPMVQYVDLDGALLLAEDPYEGLPIVDGLVDLTGTGRPGTGVYRR